jgi:hypothetical protein
MNNDLTMLGAVGQVFSYSWWIILPMALFYIFKILWLDFAKIRSAGSWFKSLQLTILEIVPPREIERGPKVMESIFAGIAGVVTTHNTFDQFVKGAMPDNFSFEIVGEEGQVHFYVRTQKKYRNMIEAQVYAQYPDAEIYEVEDYTNKFPKMIPNKYWDLWGTDFEFVMPPAYPIKTYDKFEESVTGEMIDPMAAIAEVIGTLAPGQHYWLQFILIPISEAWSKDQKKVVDEIAGRVKKGAKGGILHDLFDVFSNIFKALHSPVEFKKDEKKEEAPLEFRLTPMEKEVLKAVEENIGRNVYNTKMRFLYLGRRENFEKAYVGTFMGALKQFNDMNMNQLKPNDISKTYANYLFKTQRLAFRQRKIYNRYKNRSPDGALVLLSTKEMATLFHFPDMGVKSPSVPRISSKLGTAPMNLPVE